ncbi:MAG: deoxyribose-phosphate aldolase [Rhodobacteraceae bacterium]|nr:deoxyribose-phosphate aldolase [Paracoccaceae bacterium]
MAKLYRGAELAKIIDISCVQTFHSADDIVSLAKIANQNGFVAAHVLPSFVLHLKDALGAGTRTLVGGPIGFPSGGATTKTKIAEAQELVAIGAQELDMMINVGRLISGDTAYVAAEIKAVAEAIAPVPMKVLLEMEYLSEDQIRAACAMAIEAGAAFVKTSTGWGKQGASIEKLRIIADACQGEIQIKASGGIRDLKTVDAFVALGVTRFGINTRSAVELVQTNEVSQ